MQAIILCGGRGERLMPMTACTPAGLLRIAGKSVISYALDQLKKAGFTEVTLALGYLGNQVINEFEEGEYNGMKLCFTSTNQIGTASAVHFACKEESDALIIEANCVFDFDLAELVDYHYAKNSLATFVTKQDIDASEHIAFSTDDDEVICEMSTFPSHENTNAVNTFTGVYVLSHEAFDRYDFDTNADIIADIVPQMISDNNEIYICDFTSKLWQKIIDAKGFIECQKSILSGKFTVKAVATNSDNGIYSDTESNFSGVSIIPPVYIGKNVSIESGAIIEPGTVLDDNCIVETRTRICGGYVGREAHIYSRCEVAGSVICANAKLRNFVIVGEGCAIGEKSIIGENVRIDDNIKVWAAKEIRPNTVLSENIKTGIGARAYIDNDSTFVADADIPTPMNIAKFGLAVGSALDIGDKLVVGWKGSDHAGFLTESFKSGVLACGVKIMDIGECTAQQAMFATKKLGAEIGCLVCVDYSCKVKIFAQNGLPLKRELERRIELAHNNSNFRNLAYSNYGESFGISGVTELYDSYIAQSLPNRLCGVNVQVRASSKLYAKIADKLFHDKNDIEGEKVIFHLSADGSACSAYSDKTGYVLHERLILLGMKIAYKKQIPISLPYSFPLEADTLAEDENGHLYRYYNSSDNAEDDKAREVAKRLDNIFVRDGLTLAAIIAGYLSEMKITFSQAMSEIPKFYSIQRFVSLSTDTRKLLNEFSMKKSGFGEGVAYKNEHSRALLRPLKHGNGIMIFAESYKSETASSICDDIEAKIKQFEKADGKI